jgi:hypothetical protein
MDFDFQQYFTKVWMHELRQILLNPPTNSRGGINMITGLKRSSGTGDSRLPITRQMLQQIVRVFSCVYTSQFEVKLFTAAFALIFHGLFRIS